MSGELILVVDDNPSNLKLMEVLLTASAYVVRMAANAEETLSILRDCQPRLILMDIQLPGMDGLALTRRLKADPGTREVPIVILTACATSDVWEEALASGCAGYMTKPINSRSLASDIERYLHSL